MKLDSDFYLNADVLEVSKQLLGKFLVTSIEGVVTSGMIVETEAYRGPDDRACHAFNNRRTPRTEMMYAPGGVAYVYLCYGIHHLFNVVTGPVDMAHVVLIRAVEPVDNIPAMLSRRKMEKIATRLTAGPGVLSQAFGITTELNGSPLTGSNPAIWIEDRSIHIPKDQIQSSPRIGVESAGESALWDWRFTVGHSKWVSGPKVRNN